ncbi:LysE family translocator [Rhodalgimonas zhirmunskyi]|uniref:LysE family transporter n=1 Tax=Rhodalgimonas zhirmunskyi TaxID=2964767 RepID=A0AAJ1X427_9RHOB|nr:LysE family transporter [Rhodoalgimonas zhirmunskyi]MDQ2092689.1 LysE family transporter [Rhodoalgimonas zhirmunskyi]
MTPDLAPGLTPGLTLAQIIAFNLTLLAAMASPGPAMLLAIRATLTGGRATGIATGLGLATMAAGWTAMALIGLDTLFRLFPWAYLAMKLAGAAYLLWIAFHMWRDARTPLDPGQTAAPPKRHAFRSGLLVNLANPKSVLFAASVLVVIFPGGLSLADKSLIVLNHLLVEVTAYAAFALLLSTKPARDGYLRLKPLFDRLAAAILAALGLRLLLGR